MLFYINVSLGWGLNEKVRQGGLLFSFSGRKEGQISNQFKEDLFQIIDFLDINKKEIGSPKSCVACPKKQALP